MSYSNDILAGFTSDADADFSSDSDIETKLADTRDDLRQARKRLKKAEKKGKGVKKLKRKIRKLKAKCERLECRLCDSLAQMPHRSRWDGLVEKSVPEALKLITAIVNRAFPRTTRQVKRLPQDRPIYIPPNQPLYLPMSPAEEE